HGARYSVGVAPPAAVERDDSVQRSHASRGSTRLPRRYQSRRRLGLGASCFFARGRERLCAVARASFERVVIKVAFCYDRPLEYRGGLNYIYNRRHAISTANAGVIQPSV